jgi:hypothetical protein
VLERRRQTPAARAARARSRHRYGSRSNRRALAVAKQKFRKQLTADVWKGVQLEAGERVRAHPTPNTLLVSQDGVAGDAIVESNVPLQAKDESGDLAPVELALQDRGAALESRNPIVPVKYFKDARKGFELERSGIAVHPADAPGPAASPLVTVSSKPFFANVDTDTDFWITPEPAGAQAQWQLRSQNSPERLGLDLNLPPGARVRIAAQGYAQVVRDKEALAFIGPPAAVDADGQQVPVEYDVNNKRLTVVVSHRAGDFMYPIAVDPSFNEYYDWPGGYVPWQGQTNAASVTNAAPWQGQNFGHYYMFPNDPRDAQGHPNLGGAGLYILGGAVAYADGEWAEWYIDPWRSNITIPRAEFQTSQRSQYTCTYTGLWTNPDQYRHQDCTWYDGYWDISWLPGASTNWDFIRDDQKDFARATFGYIKSGAGTPCCTHWTVLNRSAVFYWDYYTPTISVADFGSRPWSEQDSVTLTGRVFDQGFGLKSEHVTTPGKPDLVLPWTSSCSGTRNQPCPEEPAFVGNNLPLNTASDAAFAGREGRIPVYVDATDAATRNTTKRVVEFKIDRSPPVQNISGTLKQPDGTWVKGGPLTLSNNLFDAYSGVQTDAFTVGPGTLASDTKTNTLAGSSGTCTGSAALSTGCELTMPHDWTWTTTPGQDGAHQVSVTTKDPLGHTTAATPWTVNVDSKSPTLSGVPSGSLWSNQGRWIREGTYDLHVTATDPAPGSGVEKVKVTVDGVPVDTAHESQACGVACPASMTRDFTFDATSAAQGQRHIQAFAYDKVQNTPATVADFWVKVDRDVPNPQPFGGDSAPPQPAGAKRWVGIGPHTLASTPSDGYSGVKSQSAAVARVTGSDGFARTTPVGWGTAARGGAWQLGYSTGGTASTDGSAGSMFLGQTQTQIMQLAGISPRDVDMRVRFRMPAAAGGSLGADLVARRHACPGAPAEQCQLRVGLTTLPSGAFVLRGMGATGALWDDVATGLTWTANDRYWLRMRVVGVNPTTVQAKAWKEGTTEPAAWTVSKTGSQLATPSEQVAGGVGLRATSQLAGTKEVRFDSFQVEDLTPPSSYAPGCDASTGCPTNPGEQTYNWTATEQDDPGDHQVVVTTTDAVDHADVSSWAVSLDNVRPSFSNPTGSLAQHGGTVGLGPQSLSVDATDAHSGVKAVDLEIDHNPVGHVDGNCTTTQCDATKRADFTWDSSDSSGQLTVTVRITDFVGNVFEDSWDILVEDAPPSVSLSGALYDKREQGVPDGSYQLHAHATDGDATARSRFGSGVTHIEVRLDNHTEVSKDQPCDAGNCPLDADWTADTGPLDEGPHTVDVLARDRFGYEKTETFVFTASRTPVNTVVPTVSGQPVDGETLTGTAGSWSGAPLITYSYQWQHCDASGGDCMDLVGETDLSIALRSEDVASTLRLQVTAHNGGAASIAYSGATPAVIPVPPANTDVPDMIGEPTVGQRLSAGDGIWDGSIPIAYSYQWLRCNPLVPDIPACSAIPDATGADYDIAAADSGQVLRVRVTATNDAGPAAAVTAYSNPSEQIGSFQADPNEVSPSEPPPPTAGDDMEYAQSFRSDLGLNSDPGYIQGLDAQPGLEYSRVHYGLSLSRYEQRDWELRESMSSEMRIVGDYGSSTPSYSGFYISDDVGGSLVHVGFTSDSATHLDELRALFPYPSRLRVFDAAYTLQELEAIQQQVSADYESGALAASGVEWAGDGVNEETNRLEIEVTNPSPGVEGALTDRYGAAVTMIPAEIDEKTVGRTKPQRPSGGLLIYPHPPRDPQHPEEGHCTLGFIGIQQSTQSLQSVQAIVTAGHCSDSYTYYPDSAGGGGTPQARIVNPEEWHQGRRTIGRTSSELTVNSALPGEDRTFDKTPSSDAVSMGLEQRFEPKPYVYIDSHTEIKVTEQQETKADDGRGVKVCASLGESNDTRCGKVTKHRSRPPLHGYPRVLDARFTNIRGVLGDSGSPYFLDTRKGTKDETMAMGVGFELNQTSGRTVYSSAQHIQDDIHFRIALG